MKISSNFEVKNLFENARIQKKTKEINQIELNWILEWWKCKFHTLGTLAEFSSVVCHWHSTISMHWQIQFEFIKINNKKFFNYRIHWCWQKGTGLCMIPLGMFTWWFIQAERWLPGCLAGLFFTTNEWLWSMKKKPLKFFLLTTEKCSDKKWLNEI